MVVDAVKSSAGMFYAGAFTVGRTGVYSIESWNGNGIEKYGSNQIRFSKAGTYHLGFIIVGSEQYVSGTQFTVTVVSGSSRQTVLSTSAPAWRHGIAYHCEYTVPADQDSIQIEIGAENTMLALNIGLCIWPKL